MTDEERRTPRAPMNPVLAGLLRWGGAVLVLGLVVVVTIPLLLTTLSEAVHFGDGEEPLEEVAEEPDPEEEPEPEEPEEELPETYEVQPGDSLQNIAIEIYGDVTMWRRIAEANDIEEPGDLQAGQTLEIPPRE